jgi:NAD(P)-dependent dehydrogenase (short-subunit alcohol dehydrogenase family)
MREVYSRWMEANGGAIVNIIADIWHGWPEFGHSAAARGGMLTLTETAACEWSSAGVRVNAVAPGGIISSGFDTYTPEMQKKLYDFTECSALARRPKYRPRSHSYYRRPRLISPAPVCALMAERRMRVRLGNWSLTAAAYRLKGSIAPRCLK